MILACNFPFSFFVVLLSGLVFGGCWTQNEFISVLLQQFFEHSLRIGVNSLNVWYYSPVDVWYYLPVKQI